MIFISINKRLENETLKAQLKTVLAKLSTLKIDQLRLADFLDNLLKLKAAEQNIEGLLKTSIVK